MSLTKMDSVLVVDDVSDNIDVLAGILKPHYRVLVATDGEKALKIINSSRKPDIILLDVMMPGLSGYEVCEKIKRNPDTKNIPVIFVTAKSEVSDETKGFDVGGVDYITKPVSPPLVLARVKTHLENFDKEKMLYRLVGERTVELNNTRLQIIQRLGRAAEYKDNETGLHVIRMSQYSKIIAEGLDKSSDFCELLLNAAPMHDVGKIGIADSILLKPGKLDEDEWAKMRQHPQIGADIIGRQSNDLLDMARVVAITHHEKWNGKGYPNNLVAEEIPLEGRIVAIADVFDALTTERPYKKAWDIDKAVKLIQEESGEHFDPNIVPVFMERLDDILKVKSENEENMNEDI